MGGGIHSCGKGDHLIPALLDLPSLTAIDLGQPEMNNLDAVYAQTVRQKIPLIRIRVSEQDLRSGAVLKRFPTGAFLMHVARSADHARELMKAYETFGV